MLRGEIDRNRLAGQGSGQFLLLGSALGLDHTEAVLGHPIAGASWEGYVVETLLNLMPPRCQASFYRTAAGAEMDLVIDHPSGGRWALEIKRSLAPKLSRGFHCIV